MKRRGDNRQHWSSYLGFVLASIGSAVGLGNVWRYPYYLHDYGIYFLVFTVLSLVFFGIPFLFFEIVSGHACRRDFRSLLKSLPPFLAVIPFLCLILIASYYSVVDAWALGMAVGSLFKVSFSSFISSFAPIFVLIVLGLVYWVVKHDVAKGIEVVDKWAVPVLFLMLLAFLVLAFTKVSVSQVLRSLAKPFDPQVPAYAIAQVFFSLSVGSGILYTYALYDEGKKKRDFASSLAVAIADFASSVIAGLVVVAFLLLVPQIKTQDTSGVLFYAISAFFGRSIVGVVMAAVFFFLVFLAGFTSLCSMLEPLISTQIFGGKTRKQSAGRVALVITFFALLISIAPRLAPCPCMKDVVKIADHAGSFLLLLSSLVFIFAVLNTGSLDSVFPKDSFEAKLIKYCKFALPAGIIVILALSFI